MSNLSKIIKGKRYNTASAEWIDTWHSEGIGAVGLLPDNYFMEALYRKKTGEYFLHGAGGKGSPYAEFSPDGVPHNGEKIIPLSDDAAHQWAKDKLIVTAYEAAFNTPSDDTISHLSFRVSHSEAEKLKQYALKHNKSQLAVIRDYIKTL